MAQLKLKLGQAAGLQVLTGDCVTVLPTLAAESIQCCVTSPPYWGLRDYDHSDQIGAEASPELYVRNLVSAFREVRRTLRKDGTLWLNVGDGYARNGGTGRCGPNAVVGNTKKHIQKRNCRVPEVWGLKDRDLMGLPWRVAFALQEDGWILRSRIAWIKKTAMPESVKNRPTNATEEIFLFAKSPTYYYDSLAVREETGANLRNYWILGPDPTQATTATPQHSHASWQEGASCWVRAREIGFWTRLVDQARPELWPTTSDEAPCL